jgi:hypothetical protein
LQWFASAAVVAAAVVSAAVVVVAAAAVVVPCSLFYQNRSIQFLLSHERGRGTEEMMRKVYVCNYNPELSITCL